MKLHKKKTVYYPHKTMSCTPPTTFETLLYNLCPIFVTVNDFFQGKSIFYLEDKRLAMQHLFHKGKINRQLNKKLKHK